MQKLFFKINNVTILLICIPKQKEGLKPDIAIILPQVKITICLSEIVHKF